VGLLKNAQVRECSEKEGLTRLLFAVSVPFFAVISSEKRDRLAAYVAADPVPVFPGKLPLKAKAVYHEEHEGH